VKFAVLACAAAFLIYIVSPTLANRMGSVREAHERKALTLDLPTLHGGQWSLAQQKGEVVLVNFWATWCPPCRTETPGLVSIAKRYSGKGVQVVGITMDDDRHRVPEFISRYGISYPILLPTDDSPLASSIESLPTSLLIDRNGRVARTYIGAVDEGTLARDIERLLAEST
jgi:cytochrome c biogenesis protein CcmG/thiol:disulfide interchange protein DsbE